MRRIERRAESARRERERERAEREPPLTPARARARASCHLPSHTSFWVRVLLLSRPRPLSSPLSSATAGGDRGRSPALRGRRHAVLRALPIAGGPVGLDNLAAAIGEAKDTIEDVIEPFLIQQGFLQRTPRGRIATPRTYHHLGFDAQS